VLEVRRRWRDTEIVQEIAFYRDLERVDFRTVVDWRETGGPEAGIANLKVAFTASLDAAEAWFETPFAATRRPADGQEVPALRWADVGDETYGVALLNDGRSGHDALGPRLRLSLARGPYEPDAVSGLGREACRYSLVPHRGSWRDAGVARQAAGFNQPLIARVAAGTPGPGPRRPRPETADAGAVVASLKAAHDGAGRALRVYEGHGRPAALSVSGLGDSARAWAANVVEDRLEELEVRGGRVEVALGPWEVRTVVWEGPAAEGA
jgi:alpha-mannosidase